MIVVAILVALAVLIAMEENRQPPRRMGTAQGPKKPNPPPALHGHTLRPVSGDLFQAIWRELGPDGEVPRGYLVIAGNVGVWARTDPTPPPPPAPFWRRRWALIAGGLLVFALAWSVYAVALR